VSEIKTRTLSKMARTYFGTLEGVRWSPLNGWNSIAPSIPGNALLGWETRIDLQGHKVQDLTFFPTAQAIQEPGIYAAVLASPSGSYLEVLEILSQIPLGLQEIADQWSGGGIAPTGSVPSFLESTSSSEDIVMGRYRAMMSASTASDLTMYNTVKADNFGSGEPTASDELYIYILVRIVGTIAEGDTLRIPERRFVLAGVVDQEPNLEYLMRLKRSYELAGEN